MNIMLHRKLCQEVRARNLTAVRKIATRDERMVVPDQEVLDTVKSYAELEIELFRHFRNHCLLPLINKVIYIARCHKLLFDRGPASPASLIAVHVLSGIHFIISSAGSRPDLFMSADPARAS